jgi:prepilin-type N-terminal cleavage/methylation domain-containing protein
MPRHTHHHGSVSSDASRRGFTLIEVLIVIAITASIVLVVGNITNNVNLLNQMIQQNLQGKSDVAQTLNIITTEIRSASTARNGAYAIDGASTSSFSFYTSLHKNGVIEHVRYFLASSTIYRGVIEPTGTPVIYPTSSEVILDMIDNVSVSSSSPLFAYYDATYTGGSSPMSAPIVVPNIRLVQMSFTTLAPSVPPAPAAQPQFFSILVDLRNLRSN